MSTPRVSIGLPVFNGAKYLTKAIESLRAQTFNDLEIIISDNASTDETEAIARRHAALDPRIRYVRNAHNIGAAANYNQVFQLARGRYFKWAGHDDTCTPTFIERCVAVLDNDPTAVISYGWTNLIDANGHSHMTIRNRLPTDAPDAPTRFRSLIAVSYKRDSCLPVFGLIRRSALEQTALIPPYVHGDRILLAQLSLRGRFVEIPEVLFYKREHPDRHGYHPDARGFVARYVGTGPKPRAEWYDPAQKGKVVFPDWRRWAEYAAAVRNAPLSSRDRAACYAHLAYWPLTHLPLLARDLVLATDQTLRARWRHATV